VKVVLVTAAFLWALAPVGLAQYEEAEPQEPDAEVDANGNAFVPGSLNFDPDKVRVPVGGVVRWTNTDVFVPHTATEDHGLWDLGGTYGAPGPYQGFGPGESVERAFEAGTHRYYCEVHPEPMRAVVEVPVTLRKRGRRATARWSRGAPGEGLAFDVQRRRNGAPWRTLLEATTRRETTFRLGPRGTRWRVRARLRAADDEQRATDWSPVATVRR
jgi:plastocyanin